MWLDIDKARLMNLDFVQSIVLEHGPEGDRWTLNAILDGGSVEPLTSYRDPSEAHRALDRVRHALQTVVLSSDSR